MKKLLFTGLMALSLTACAMTPIKSHHRSALRKYAAARSLKVLGHKGGHGSGFLYRSGTRAYVITNKHVCSLRDKSNKILVKYPHNAFPTEEKVRKISKKHDLCAIDFSHAETIDGLTIADRKEIGQTIHVFGYPYNNPATFVTGEFAGTQTIKIGDDTIPKKECLENNGEWRFSMGAFREICVMSYVSDVITARIYPGNSGSPVFDDSGRVVGVVFAGSTRATVSNYMVPLEYLKKFVEDL